MATKGRQKALKRDEKLGNLIDQCNKKQHQCDELGGCVIK